MLLLWDRANQRTSRCGSVAEDGIPCGDELHNKVHSLCKQQQFPSTMWHDMEFSTVVCYCTACRTAVGMRNNITLTVIICHPAVLLCYVRAELLPGHGTEPGLERNTHYGWSFTLYIASFLPKWKSMDQDSRGGILIKCISTVAILHSVASKTFTGSFFIFFVYYCWPNLCSPITCLQLQPASSNTIRRNKYEAKESKMPRSPRTELVCRQTLYIKSKVSSC